MKKTVGTSDLSLVVCQAEQPEQEAWDTKIDLSMVSEIPSVNLPGEKKELSL